jgi:hypothetical protein
MLDRPDFALVLWKTVSYCSTRQSITVGFETQDVGKKTIAIMRILRAEQESLSIFMKP